ncbi:hypothetical protein B0T24DRAFT_669927 [Lasiosphaeria ovina]|uniref:Uncharacterized protein n=1 Tax=Lasiosphaeria ovina TaxID=92902 RepID=A0AAE0JWN2_9PEZI|nr:hypothetical protein B0T24DRAFT_669927 [Lasiosphaeria ovina]
MEDQKMNQILASIDNKFAHLEEVLTNKFASIDSTLVSLDNRITSLDNRITSLDNRITSLDNKITSLDMDFRANNNSLLCRVIALRENDLRRNRNNAAVILNTHASLSPLLNIHTAIEIAEFPKDLGSLYELNALDIRRILEALHMTVEGKDLGDMREDLRRATVN